MIQRIIEKFCGYVGCDDATNVSNFGYEPIKFSSFMLNIRMHTMQILVLCLGWNVRLIVSLPRRYGVMTLRYNRRTASQPSHVVRQNLQKGKLRVLNPARIHVFYWFNWLNLIGS